ncbi:hypothetical protein F4821DRAFT_65392 [Hypoxylon rubiginosum]|uniref:Uncharacterized protein n=1 Tax=Hypoxylon rubiginosum TaxID=110542 RepID=A0ACC0D972_9PEZI|nr:hypothetical protein F4821DRAFT_65392 [Hypoxylon rubiginosum]
MKASTVAAVLAPSAASAQWWKGAPSCAQSCLSTAWSSPTGTVTSGWPAQSEYCDANAGNSVGACISTACESASSSTAWSSYSQLSSSLCSQYAACTSAGSTGVRTVTYSGGPVTWAAPGGWGGGDSSSAKAFAGGPHNGNSGWASSAAANFSAAASDYRQYWSEWASAFQSSRTWTGGVATVTGCAFDGSPWFVGPGCGWNGLGGFDGWVGWGSGWSWGPTSTVTVTYTTTDTAGSTTTGTGLAAVALAVSGTLTTSTTLGAPSATESAESGAAPAAAAMMVGGRGAEGSIVTGMMGLALGAIVVIAGML